MTKVSVELPSSFSEDLTKQIKQSAYEAFKEIKRQSKFPDYMSMTQVAEFLNVSRTTLDKKITPSGLPVTEVDGLLRVSKKKAIEFMEQHTH